MIYLTGAFFADSDISFYLQSTKIWSVIHNILNHTACFHQDLQNYHSVILYGSLKQQYSNNTASSYSENLHCIMLANIPKDTKSFLTWLLHVASNPVRKNFSGRISLQPQECGARWVNISSYSENLQCIMLANIPKDTKRFLTWILHVASNPVRKKFSGRISLQPQECGARSVTMTKNQFPDLQPLSLHFLYGSHFAH